MSWPLVSMSESVKVIGGFAFKSKDFEESGHSIIRISNIKDGVIVLTNAAKIPAEKIGKGSAYTVKSGDILMAMSGATTGKVGVFLSDEIEPVYLNQRVGRFLPNSDLVDEKYLWFFLRSPECQDQIVLLAEGAAQPNISSSQLESIKIPLPPLETQKQIAAVLEKADQLRKDCQQMEQELNNLAQSVFIDMFGDPVTNPKGWEVKSLIDLLLSKPQIGTTKPSHSDGTQRVVRVGELGGRKVNYEKCGGITLTGKDFERYRLFEGDFLLARAIGSRSHLGKASLFIEQDIDYVYDSHVMRLRFDSKLMSSEFYFELMKTDGGRTLFLNSSSQTAVQFNINAKQISLINLPVPPLSLQNVYLKDLKKIKRLYSSNTLVSEEYNNAFNSLMQRAFKGELNLNTAQQVA